MEEKFDFKNLVVLDLANNHQGNLFHGKKIIDNCAKLSKSHSLKAAIKFQFRDLPNFIHSEDQKDSKNKHVPRFLSTMMNWEDFKSLKEYASNKGMLTMCTPFDEVSVDKIVEMGFDIIKIASCSSKDWPLVEKVAKSGLPIVASTGGLTLSEVDDLVSFLGHKGCDFSIMHCVAIYPTPDEKCNLRNISEFKSRYPNLTIGWSTHESPEETTHIGLVKALGAEMFERHVGHETDEIKLNAYSSNFNNLENWMIALNRSEKLLGSFERSQPSEEEMNSINSLKRGVFVNRDLKKGSVLNDKNTFFAFPYKEKHLSSGDFKEGMVLNNNLKANQAIPLVDVSIDFDEEISILKKAIHEVKAMLAHEKIPLTSDFTTEYSHHYGIANFRKVGAVLINLINRDYCKKVLVQLPGQAHPSHYHKLKEETFLIVSGELISKLDGKEKVLKRGDTLMVAPGVWHSFKTETGCIFEEISTTAFANDSVYRDEQINNLSSKQRKTIVDHWGRFQLDEQLREAKINPLD